MTTTDKAGYRRYSERSYRQVVPLTELITSHACMQETLDSGRKSETPDAPVEVCERLDHLGLEISDGHHRVAEALRRGEVSVEAIIDPWPDEEPYEAPFYNFAAAIAAHKSKGAAGPGQSSGQRVQEA